MDRSRYIVVEGPIGVGKTALAGMLARSLNARLILEESADNPFLAGFYRDRKRYAFQAQLFFLLSRFRQQQELSQLDLFQRNIVGDYLFERDRLFASVNLGEEDFALYDQVFGLLADRVTEPDLVIYLAAPARVLWKRIKNRTGLSGWITQSYLEELGEVYNNFFHHFDRSPLLVVNESGVDFTRDQENYGRLLKEVTDHTSGVKHYIALPSNPA